MTPPGLSSSDLITIVIALAAGVGAIISLQHKLITNLLKDRWHAHEELHEKLEERIQDNEDAHTEVALKVNRIETIIQMREGPR